MYHVGIYTYVYVYADFAHFKGKYDFHISNELNHFEQCQYRPFIVQI